MASLAGIENALVELVKQSRIAKHLRMVDTLPALTGDKLINKFGTDAPGVYIAPVARMPIADGMVQVGFGILCVSRNAGGQAQARKGDGIVIGVYEMAEVLAAWLNGAKPDGVPLYAVGIELLQEDLIFRNGLHAALVSLAGQMDLAAAIDDADLDDFITFGAQYDIPPHVSGEQHQKWLQEPPDYTESRPELLDELTLPQE